MAKKDYFLIVDTETTNDDRVADFGAVVCDRKGNIYAECAVMVHGIFNEVDLFWNGDAGHFGKTTLEARTKKYLDMLESGSRMYASIHAINRWLENVNGKYNPILTAYNLEFDLSKCNNTNIDLSIFNQRFCLMAACQERYSETKKYKTFVLENGYLGSRTKTGKMVYKTNADVMTKFITSNPDLDDEPHTAIEDVKFYELPLLTAVVKNNSRKKWMNAVKKNWTSHIVKNHFIAK